MKGITEKLIVALDVHSREEVKNLICLLHDRVGFFKVGLELFCSFGPSIVSEIREEGGRVFLDLKFHDIPRTAAQASRAAVRMGVSMFTVHVAGGKEMLRSVVEAINEEAGGSTPPKILGVTVLTSLGTEQLKSDIGVSRTPLEQVLYWAEIAKNCGLSGVVASPHEVEAIRDLCGPEFLIVTPGIRPTGYENSDQKRVSTPAEALRLGSDYLVIGRPIVKSPDPCQAVANIISEMEEVLKC